MHRSSIRNISDYSPFGVELQGRTVSSNEFKYGFQGQEGDSEIKGKGNSYDFGARILDPRIGRWLSVDPAFKLYPNLTPYGYTANNPIMFIEIDGRVFDLGYLSKEEKKAYLEKVDFLKVNSKFFAYYYDVLDKSEHVYTIYKHKSPPGYAIASYRPDVNYVRFNDVENASETELIQELFHAYQDELITNGTIYGGDPENMPISNIETEGDVMTGYVQEQVGLSSTIYGWEGGLNNYYADDITPETLNSEEFNQAYKDALQNRVEHYTKLKNQPGSVRDYKSYTVPAKDYGPEAIMKVVKELGASENKLEGPRQENGDYYED